MSRLIASLRNDVRLQIRAGFYHAAAFVAVFAMIALRYLPASARPWGLPVLVLSNLLMGTFFFVAGLMMLERSEGSLQAIVVTPLRDGEYLAAKVATLTGLGIAENLIIVVVAHGLGFRAPLLVAGIVIGAAVYTLIGFIAAAPYAAINEYLMASIVWVAFLSLPFLQYADPFNGGWLDALFWAHPLQPSLSLLSAAFRPAPIGEIVYALAYGTIAIAVLSRRAHASFQQFVVAAGPA